ncbi:hypothetical protein RclHR1_09210013 [Rhizophagus clarus]|uniref:Uncharacterized protein n=1 Tax=Rhizophagus clarus TaxID=94130 RepID=A0A2Z6S3R4_9GLOM|nr:hypothetical protein RclHR1_09210013 [Rhizophagus clarus]GES94202.1 hypothetical protein RCL_jg27648.t1 [Rhizophagus clarus]
MEMTYFDKMLHFREDNYDDGKFYVQVGFANQDIADSVKKSDVSKGIKWITKDQFQTVQQEKADDIIYTTAPIDVEDQEQEKTPKRIYKEAFVIIRMEVSINRDRKDDKERHKFNDILTDFNASCLSRLLKEHEEEIE